MSTVPTIVANIWRCKDGVILRSLHRYDYVGHTDAEGNYSFLDGGVGGYIRHSGNMESLCVYSNDPHEVIREVFLWKSYGKDFEYPDGVYLVLKDMTTEHINAVLSTQKQIKGTYVENIFKNELEYRQCSVYRLNQGDINES